MAAPTAWTLYDQFKLALGNKVVDLDGDVIKMALFTSASNANTTNLATATYASLTGEVSNANGYTTGGVACAATYANGAGTETFDVADAQWTASGAGIAARYAVLYDSTTGHLLCWSTLDGAPADVTVSAGNTLTVQVNAAGVFTLA